MPLMFTLAGISTKYSLQKRTTKEYLKERALKLLIPLIFGILLIIPIQTYYAEVFHNGNTGSYLKQYSLFFTKWTDLTGYHGGFTPGQLWFVLYLLIISLLALPIVLWYNKKERKMNFNQLSIIKLIPMFIFPLLMAPILDFGGKSVGEYFALFLLGFFVLSEDVVLERIERARFILVTLAIVLFATRYVWYHLANDFGLLFDIHQRLTMWICILAFLGLGKRYFNFNNCFTRYFSKAGFSIYILHQSILVAVGFYVFKFVDSIPIQIGLIIAISFIITIVCYEILRRFSLTRFMFSIKK